MERFKYYNNLPKKLESPITNNEENQHLTIIRKTEIVLSDHCLKDKNISFEDLELVKIAVRYRKIDVSRSNEEKNRVCFKNYFKQKGLTYFIIAERHKSFLRIITVIKKKGKY